MPSWPSLAARIYLKNLKISGLSEVGLRSSFNSLQDIKTNQMNQMRNDKKHLNYKIPHDFQINKNYQGDLLISFCRHLYRRCAMSCYELYGKISWPVEFPVRMCTHIHAHGYSHKKNLSRYALLSCNFHQHICYAHYAAQFNILFRFW